MRITSLYVQNFMSVRRLSVDFSQHTGIVAVEGANGSGKSTVFIEAIAWLLFGKTVRKLAADGVIPEGAPDDDTAVVGLLELDDGRQVTLERRRGKRGPSFAFSFTDSAKALSDQTAFEKLIGFTWRLFSSSVLFGGPGVSSFCSLPDAERKVVLENLLDVERYVRAGKRALDTSKSIRTKLDVEKDRREQLRVMAYSLDADIKELTEKVESFETARGHRIRQVRKSVKAAEELLTQLDAQRKAAKRSFRKSRTTYKSRVDSWRDRHDAAKKSAQAARNLYSEAQSAVLFAEKELRAANEYAERLKEKYPDTCPVCGTPRQHWPDPRKEPTSAENPAHRLKQANVALKKANASFSRTRENLQEADKALEAIAEEKPEPPVESGVVDIDNRVKDVQRELRSLRANLRREQRQTENPFRAMLTKKMIVRKEVRQKFKVASARVSRYEEDLRVYDYWAKAFSRQGLPSLLLDEAAPFLTRRARRYADQLVDGRIDIRFAPAEAGRGQTFVPRVTNAEGGSSYQKSSKGERARIDLCVLLALRDLMESRAVGRFDQTFLDEVLDGLDDEGTDRVVTTLRNVFKKRTVFLLTHNAALKALADSVIVVSKVDGHTHLHTPVGTEEYADG